MVDGGRPARRRLTADAPDSVATRVVLGCIVVASVGVAMLWMFCVPFFQEPDENAHFDYAYELYSVGRAYHVERATCGGPRDVTHDVRYLEDRSDFYGVRILTGARVPPGYGTASFFRSVDAQAPGPARRMPPSGGNVPCIMFSYPAGFYAAIAGVVALADRWSGRSLVDEFFSARAFGISCLALTLPLAYKVLRASRLGTRDALLATAAIGLFPMTSWVSAYVQPDNLTFAGVTVALLLALRLTRRPFDPPASIALGFVLAALFFVKLQYAGVLFIVCLSLVLSDLTRHRIAISAQMSALAFVGLLPLIAFRAAFFATPVGTIRFGHDFMPTSASPLAETPLIAASTSIRYAAEALGDAYVSGRSFHRFWNAFGWTHVPYFESTALSSALEALVGLASLTVALCFLWRRFRVLRRIRRIAVHRSAASAARLVCHDVVLNTYMLWTALLIAVAGNSRGTWWLQGRYWLPVMAPMVVILVREFPRSFPTRMRFRVARTAVVVLLGYAALSAPFALSAAHDRYYKPSGVVRRRTVVALDGFGFLGQTRGAWHPISISRGGIVKLTGLAFLSTDGSALDRLALQVDAAKPIDARYGFPVKTGVAPMSAGFAEEIPTSALAPGLHDLKILAYSSPSHFDSWDAGNVINVVGMSVGKVQLGERSR